MIFECVNCFNRPKNSRVCELCGLPTVYGVSDSIVDLTMMDRQEQEYLDAEWAAKVRKLGSRCVYCGEEVAKRQAGLPAFHILEKDHVIPISRGGLDILWNIVPACVRCNRMKRNRTASEFIKSRFGLCKSANLRCQFQHVLFSYLERTAFAHNIEHQSLEVSLPQKPSYFWVDRRKVLREQAQILKRKEVKHVLSADKSIRTA